MLLLAKSQVSSFALLSDSIASLFDFWDLHDALVGKGSSTHIDLLLEFGWNIEFDGHYSVIELSTIVSFDGSLSTGESVINNSG